MFGILSTVHAATGRWNATKNIRMWWTVKEESDRDCEACCCRRLTWVDQASAFTLIPHYLCLPWTPTSTRFKILLAC